MTFWSSDTLKAKLPNLISGYIDSSVREASYTLRIGNEVFITRDRHTSDSQHTKQTLEDSQAFVIPPGQFAFLLTEEEIAVPDNAIAFISMKAKYKFKGLVNVSGFHVDPGFKGELIFSVYNAGPSPIHLQHKLPFFLIWYANLDKTDSLPRPLGSQTTISVDVLNQIATDEIFSHQALTEKIIDIEKKNETILRWGKSMVWSAKTLLTAVVAIIFAVVPMTYSHWDAVMRYKRAIDWMLSEAQKAEDQTKSNGDAKQVKPLSSPLHRIGP